MTVRQAIRASLNLLTQRDRRLLAASIVIQMSTAFLDLAGVLLLGLVAALAVTVVQSQPAPDTVQDLAEFVGLGDLSGQQLVLVLALAAAAVLLAKSVVSSYLNRRVLIFLANRQALVTGRLVKELLSRPLVFLQRRASQETSYALIQGAAAATIHILGQTAVLLTEIALLVVLATALLFLDPIVTLGAIAFFALVGFILQRTMGSWAHRVGRISANADIASLNTIQEALASYREISVSNRRDLYVKRIEGLRWEASRLMADRVFISLLPKYVFEAALVVGGFLLAGALFATQESVAAVGTLALFLAAGSRVMPSLLRLQTSSLTLRDAAGTATVTFQLADELGNPMKEPHEWVDLEVIRAEARDRHEDFEPAIELVDVSVTYPGASEPALSGISLELPAGSSLALIGPSGAGKSTLADVILGVLQPDSGVVRVGGVSPSEAVSRWPGGIAYVPQEVLSANETVKRNVALGLPDEAIDEQLVWEALERAHLDTFLREQRDGLNTNIGESGLRLSGGQRQRLGIARALYTRPKLLVLDEATSSLDTETESAITRTIRDLEGSVTTVIVAHRLSTVKHVDQCIYIDHGSVVSEGTFADVVKAMPPLARSTRLLDS